MYPSFREVQRCQPAAICLPNIHSVGQGLFHYPIVRRQLQRCLSAIAWPIGLDEGPLPSPGVHYPPLAVPQSTRLGCAPLANGFLTMGIGPFSPRGAAMYDFRVSSLSS